MAKFMNNSNVGLYGTGTWIYRAKFVGEERVSVRPQGREHT